MGRRPETVALNGYPPFEDWYVKPELVDMAKAEKIPLQQQDVE